MVPGMSRLEDYCVCRALGYGVGLDQGGFVKVTDLKLRKRLWSEMWSAAQALRVEELLAGWAWVSFLALEGEQVLKTRSNS